MLFAPTVDGNMLAGPTAQDIDDREDKSTSADGLSAVMAGVMKYVPAVDPKQAIATFAGLRAVPEGGDFIIGISKTAPNFVNAAGIESPGLTSAPAIAQYAADLLFLDRPAVPGKPKSAAGTRADRGFCGRDDRA